MSLSFYEFFAGGGMVRAGRGDSWECLFANDFDHKKGRTYRDNWAGGQLKTIDVGRLKLSDIPDSADLAWASFPCQDLSLAGRRQRVLLPVRAREGFASDCIGLRSNYESGNALAESLSRKLWCCHCEQAWRCGQGHHLMVY